MRCELILLVLGVIFMMNSIRVKVRKWVSLAARCVINHL